MAESPTIIPSLRYKDGNAAIGWLTKAFGFTAGMVVPGEDGGLAHAELTYHGGAVMLGSTTDGGDGRLPVETGPSWTYVVVPDDVEAHYRRALAAGAEVVQELENTGYGSQGYTVRDPEGHVWSFGTYTVDVK
jgi:uncharacterized glyoxalase superfamily protein PhnB